MHLDQQILSGLICLSDLCFLGLHDLMIVPPRALAATHCSDVSTLIFDHPNDPARWDFLVRLSRHCESAIHLRVLHLRVREEPRHRKRTGSVRVGHLGHTREIRLR